MSWRKTKPDDLLVRSLVKDNMYVLNVVKYLLGRTLPAFPKQPTAEAVDEWALKVVGVLHARGFDVQVSDDVIEGKSILTVSVWLHGTVDAPTKTLLFVERFPGSKSPLSGDSNSSTI